MKLTDQFKQHNDPSIGFRQTFFTDCNVIEFILMFWRDRTCKSFYTDNSYRACDGLEEGPRKLCESVNKEVSNTRVFQNFGGIYPSSEPTINEGTQYNPLQNTTPTAHVLLTGDPEKDTDDNIFKAACYALRQTLPLKSQGDGGFECLLPQLISIVYGSR